MDFDWISERQVAAMSRPWPEDVDELKRLGITSVLSLTGSVPDEVVRSGLETLHLPVRDFHPPSEGQIEAAVEFIELTVSRGGACAVHCGAGLGRTGTIVAAWLVRRGRTAPEAIVEVRRRRPGSVETRAQEQAVERYARRLSHGSGGEPR